VGSPAARPDRRAGARLTLRVLALALLGYAYVLGVFAGLLIVAVAALLLAPSVAALVWVTIPLVALAAVVLRALLVRLPPPEGIRLTRREAPDLFGLLHELRRELRAPRLHGVWVDGSFNASVAQTPRLGIVGPYRNTLVVGLPLLQGLLPEELRAVLAHELGHVSRRHGRTSAWVYRLRETWESVLTHLESAGHWGVVLFRPFLRWYVPRFERASLALAHAHEFEADRASMLCVGVETTSSALVRSAVGGTFLAERFWPELWEQAEHDPTPARPHALVARPLRHAGEHEDADRWLAEALATDPEVETTHPPLRARLLALGLEPERVRPRPAAVSVSAATAILGPHLVASLVETLDKRWGEEVASAWQAQHEEAREARSRLAELEAQGSWRDLPQDELQTYARLVSRVRSLENARAVWERVLELEPDSGEALLALGELAAERGDPEAGTLLERAAEVEPILAPTALATLAAALAKHGRDSEAAASGRRAAAAQQELEEAHAERSHLTPADRLAPHGLPDDAVARITAVLDRQDIARAYLTRKATEALDDRYPVFVVGYVRRGRAWRYERRGAADRLREELFEALGEQVPGPFWLVDVTEDAGLLHKRLRGVEGACMVRSGYSARPLARAAPVLVGLLILGGIAARLAGDDAPADPFATPFATVQDGMKSDARGLWTARADELCSVQRTHAALRLENVQADGGALAFPGAWKVLRPFEVDLAKGLAALPDPPLGAKAVVRSLRKDIAALDKAAETRRKADAAAQLERLWGDDLGRHPVAAFGAPTCATPVVQAR
jgi:Zn-dependent protease with chaperone function